MTRIVTAQPFTARYCDECDTYIYVAGGPFADDDPTCTLADGIHWEIAHGLDYPEYEIGIPFMFWNEKTVQAEICPWASPIPADEYQNLKDSWEIMDRTLPAWIVSE